MGPLGYQEMIFIFVIALLVFGPKKLPELGKTVGKAMSEFRRATNDLKGTWDREMANMERETGIKEATRQIDHELQSASIDATYHDTSSSYDSGHDYGHGGDYSHANELAAAITPGLETTPSTDGATATQGAGTTVAELEPPSESAQPGEAHPHEVQADEVQPGEVVDTAHHVPDTIAREKPVKAESEGSSLG